MKRRVIHLFPLVLLLSGSLSSHALTQVESIADTEMTVYAPDWIWQKSAANLLITFENRSNTDSSGHLRLLPPKNFESHFAMELAIIEGVTVSIPAAKTMRHAFTNIIALDGFDLQTYDFELVAEMDGESLRVAYPLTTIRGPVVNTAKWAMLLPAVLCAAWCVVFIVALHRFAKPGAWKEPSNLDLDDAS